MTDHKKIVLVEGNEDQAFLDALNYFSPKVDYDITITKGKTEIKPKLETLLKIGVLDVTIAEDYDNHKSFDEYKKNFRSYLVSNYGNSAIQDLQRHNFLVMETTTVNIIPLGLPSDEILSEFSLTKFMLEDHLIKILLSDDTVISKISHRKFDKSKEFRTKLNRCLATLKENKLPTGNSKILIEISKILLDIPTSTATFARIIVENSSKDVLTNILKRNE